MLQDEERTTEELAAENRSLRFAIAAARYGMRPNAVKAAEALLDMDRLDTELAAGAAVRELRQEHGYLFRGPGSVDAGARHHGAFAGGGLEEGLTPKERMARGHEQNDLNRGGSLPMPARRAS